MNKIKFSLVWAHPIIQTWFLQQLGNPSEPQIKGWPSIVQGHSTLISAPTGSGKTLAAFLVCIDQLFKKSLEGKLLDQIEVIYISPLKALSNDIQKNLTEPLQKIFDLAQQQHLTFQNIHVGLRTGDTKSSDRAKMLKKPPHILVTTPESFYLLLTAEKSHSLLTQVKTVIVDEIHALANNKRGTHLSLSLERLEALNKNSFVRIGLSATQKPIELIADFLTGRHSKANVIQIGHQKELKLSISVPPTPLSSVISQEMWEEIYAQIKTLTNENRSMLIFVNTRRLAEKIAHQLQEHLGKDQVAAHHGSLSRKIRFQIETDLKAGNLKVVVATASLELGIDIGFIDLVCQIGSPRAISLALQRVGRAGHWQGAISKAIFFPTTRDELLECAALVKAIEEGDLDQLIIPEEPIDILAQQIVATCATKEWQTKQLWGLLRKSYPYQNLTTKTFNTLLEILSNGIAGARNRYAAYLFWDQINGRIKARRGARLTALMNGGAIPETGLFTVYLESDNQLLGTLDEDFAIESMRGDIILLGSTSWRIEHVEMRSGRVLVSDAKGAPPNVPFWRGEAPARTNELSLQVSQFREYVEKLFKKKPLAEWIDSKEVQRLEKKCGLPHHACMQLLDYLHQGFALLGRIPSQQTIIAERFFDESGGMQLIIHAPFGARINKAWGLALRKRFCRSFDIELQAAATDNSINIALTEQHSFPLAEIFDFLHSQTVESVLTQAVLQSPLFKSRWRWVATRSLALKRFSNGKKIPPYIQRMRADDLLAAIFPDAAACQDNLAGRDLEIPDHPLITETLREIFTDALDVEGLKTVLKKIKAGEIKCIAVDTPQPSVFAHEILNANPFAFLDEAPLEERRARAIELRRTLPSSLKEIGQLSHAAIQAVKEQAWPDIRDADELHDFLQAVIVLPKSYLEKNENKHWENFFDQLLKNGRAGTMLFHHKLFLLATEKKEIALQIYPDGQLQQELPTISQEIAAREDNIANMINAWLSYLGPVTAAELQTILELEDKEIQNALLLLETKGIVLRGNFRQTTELEWCERRLLARIHRLTLENLRREIEAVTPKHFLYWLFHWQHVSTQTQLEGKHGLLEIIKQLQGFELSAYAWEKYIFAKRIKNYDAMELDFLCLTGQIVWGHLSSRMHYARKSIQQKKILATRVSPITFWLRDEIDWIPKLESFIEKQMLRISPISRQVYHYLQQRGASFFTDIVRGVNHLKTEVETALWELTAAGLITADSFDNLRAFINPKRRLQKKTRFIRRFNYPLNAGRWSILEIEPSDSSRSLEASCWVLLKRYGIIFRDLLSKEKNFPTWRELLPTLRKLEAQGEIRGGRFVSGFTGEQFALNYAVESLRASKKEMDQEVITLSKKDPLNLSAVLFSQNAIHSADKKEIKFIKKKLY